MSALAEALVHAQPEAPKIGSRFTPPGAPDSEPGMWSVLGSKGTTSNRTRSKAAGKVVLITVPAPVLVVGATPLISLTTYVPCSSQLNRSLPDAGAQGGVPVQPEFVHAYVVVGPATTEECR